MHLIVGSGEPVVFVHGNASIHSTWSAVMAPMSQQYRCISYDLRGHGGPELPPGHVSLELLADDLEQLRAALALPAMRLVGHSLGAFIAAAYARKHPERVTALALLAAPANRSAADKESGEKLIERLRCEGVEQVMSALQQSWYRAAFVAARPDALRERMAQIRTIPDDVFIRTYELYNATEIAPWLPSLTMPTLVMTGEHARLCGADVAKAIVGQLPKAALVIFDDFKNGILTEIPERVADELLRFFRTS
jgi:3-oxoadipate enol-lactonase/3-oxoadipate enol-lactonase/4-carboxymuconolactone decarboxylase